MPKLSVKAFSELLGLPAYEQVRILYEQKYPKRQPQVFKIPYYAQSLRAIREYYRSGCDTAQLRTAEARVAHIRLDSQRDNNLRVIRQFEHGSQRNRALIVAPRQRRSATLHSVELTLQFDLEGSESSAERFLLYNTRAAPIGEETARTTLELAQWVLGQAGKLVSLGSIEYVDLPSDKAYRYSKPRASTLKHASNTAGIITTLWPTI